MIVIVGATASGKTDLAVALARTIGGEIVSADSRQVYQEISAGTAKPCRDRAGRVEGVPYHLVDCTSLAETYDAGRFATAARAVVVDINNRGLIPIVTGGSGLYVRAFLEGLSDLPPRDEGLRRRLEAEALAHGRLSLHERLSRLDPEAAAAIPANNIQRVVRALEVCELTGHRISTLWKNDKEKQARVHLVPTAAFRIDWPADDLRRRIVQRAESMWPGMLAEVRGLLRSFTGQEPGFNSLGYPEAVACVRGELGQEEGLRRLVQATCAYAKRQRTWFRHQIAATPLAGGCPKDMTREALALIAQGPSRTSNAQPLLPASCRAKA